MIISYVLNKLMYQTLVLLTTFLDGVTGFFIKILKKINFVLDFFWDRVYNLSIF